MCWWSIKHDGKIGRHDWALTSVHEEFDSKDEIGHVKPPTAPLRALAAETQTLLRPRARLVGR
jgi:hypothetical protein